MGNPIDDVARYTLPLRGMAYLGTCRRDKKYLAMCSGVNICAVRYKMYNQSHVAMLAALLNLDVKSRFTRQFLS